MLVSTDNGLHPILILGYTDRRGNEIIDVDKEEDIEHIKRILHLEDQNPGWYKVVFSHTPETGLFRYPRGVSPFPLI